MGEARAHLSWTAAALRCIFSPCSSAFLNASTRGSVLLATTTPLAWSMRAFMRPRLMRSTTAVLVAASRQPNADAMRDNETDANGVK